MVGELPTLDPTLASYSRQYRRTTRNHLNRILFAFRCRSSHSQCLKRPQTCSTSSTPRPFPPPLVVQQGAEHLIGTAYAHTGAIAAPSILVASVFSSSIHVHAVHVVTVPEHSPHSTPLPQVIFAWTPSQRGKSLPWPCWLPCIESGSCEALTGAFLHHLASCSSQASENCFVVFLFFVFSNLLNFPSFHLFAPTCMLLVRR